MSQTQQPDESGPPLLQGEELLRFYSEKAEDSDEEHQPDCPCCQER